MGIISLIFITRTFKITHSRSRRQSNNILTLLLYEGDINISEVEEKLTQHRFITWNENDESLRLSDFD